MGLFLGLLVRCVASLLKYFTLDLIHGGHDFEIARVCAMVMSRSLMDLL